MFNEAACLDVGKYHGNFAGFWIKFMEQRNDKSMHHFNL
jgi:hypothetical protein